MRPGRNTERFWVLGFALFVILLTSFPYIMALSSQGEEWVFTGFVFGVDDGNSYIAKMLSGAHGDWLFRSAHTAAEQRGALIFLPYLLLGKLAGPSAGHLIFVLLFHLFRVVSIGLLAFAAYSFFSLYLDGVGLRRLALALAMVGGGLGWLLPTFGVSEWFGTIPLDFYSPETFGFLAVYGLPHLVLARALLFWGLVAYLKNEILPDRKGAARVALLWLALSLVHLLAALIGLLLMGLHALASRALVGQEGGAWQRSLAHIGWAVAGGAIPLLYNAWGYLNDPYLQAWAQQNLITSPHPLHYLLAYGLFIPFAYLASGHALRRAPRRALLPVLWLLILPILVYLPIGLQRRLADGAWLALLALALSFFEARNWRHRQRFRWLFLAAVPSTLFLLLGGLQAARAPAQPVFRPRAEVDVFEQLAQLAEEDELVLGAFESGNALPAWAPLRVLIGHGPESVGLAELAPRVADFYRETTGDTLRRDLLAEFSVAYVLHGPAEEALGEWSPEEMSGLQLVLQEGPYAVYRVIELP